MKSEVVIVAFLGFLLLQGSGGAKGGHPKKGHLKMGFRTESRTRHVDFPH